MSASRSPLLRSAAGLAVLLAAAAVLLWSASPAAATEYQRPFIGTFGSVEQPSFGWPTQLAADPDGGDLLVGDTKGANGGYTISRFNPDGTAAPFSALNTNEIDGEAGPGGKPCAEEPASCDATPQGGLGALNAAQIAVDASGGITNGDIYVTVRYIGGPQLIDVFSAEGVFLGQITRAGTRAISPCGVAVDPSGALYVSSGTEIFKYVPSQNPPLDSDEADRFVLPARTNQCALALGTGPSAGSLFVTAGYPSHPIFKLNKESGEVDFTFGKGNMPVINPANGNLIVANENDEAIEYDASGETEAATVSRFVASKGTIYGLAVKASGNVYVTEGAGEGKVSEYGPPGALPTVEVGSASEITATEATLSGSVNAEGVEVEGCGFEILTAAQVSEGSEDETQKVAPSGATGGQFTLTFEGQTTGAIPYGASGAEVQASLEALSTVGARNVNVAKFNAGLYYVTFEGALAATDLPQLEADPSGLTPAGATVEVKTNKQGRGWGNAKVAGCGAAIPTDSTAHQVQGTVSGLTPGGVEYVFRLVAKNENGTATAEGSFRTADTVRTEKADGIGLTEATLNGTVLPMSHQYTECFFEWGLAANPGFEHTATCEPKAAEVPADSSSHEVSAKISGLKQARTYRFRLVATNAEGTKEGEPLTFETAGPPKIGVVGASDADQSSVTLEAWINPSRLGTSYRFEWGPTKSYGYVAPAEPGTIGAGNAPVRATARITGLSPASTYHFRVIATNAAVRGTRASGDRTLETLNSCGLPDRRCFELVSRADAGPVATPGRWQTALQPLFSQAAATGPGAVAYLVGAGYPDSTRSLSVLYESRRGADGWSSAQLSPPFTARSETGGGGNNSDRFLGLSKDLSCGVVESNQPLTDDPRTRLVVESGGANLYRRDSGGSYTAISNLAPENPTASANASEKFNLAGLSEDCGKVVFTTAYSYPGVSGPEEWTGASGAVPYEWDEGKLRYLGIVPGPSGEVAAKAAGPGNPLGGFPDWSNVVSADGSRVFFSAERQTSPNHAEIGKTAVFAREDGTTTRDLSLSETSVPDTGATYQYATKDGSRVFFTANAGLTAESSPAGTDLYEYDYRKPGGERLTDLSIDHHAGGAQVGGFLGASGDGSVVYFIARAQLVAGKGRTLEQNQNGKTYSIYRASGGSVDFVATLAERDVKEATVAEGEATSRVSPDGRYLAFESRARVTNYDNAGTTEAYLYDSATPASAPVCVSCRQDGGEPFAVGLAAEPTPLLYSHHGESLAISGGQAEVFFRSFDSLAPGGKEGEATLYEWSHGQVFRLATEPLGIRPPVEAPQTWYVNLVGASADGSDLYLSTPQSLTWEEDDGRSSIYDARVGGGFPEPAPPPAPCDAAVEGSCQGPGSTAPPAVPPAASKSFSGPGNVKAEPKRYHKRHRKHHRRGHRGKRRHGGKHGKKRHGRRAGARHANRDRRAGK